MSWYLPQIIIKVLLPVSMEIHVLVLATNHHQRFVACINGDTCLGPCHKSSSKICCLYQWRYMSWSMPQIIIKDLLPVSMEIHVLVLATNHHQSFVACINGDTCLGSCHKSSSKFCCLYQWRYMSWSLLQMIIKVLFPVSMEIHVLVLVTKHHQSFVACINGDTCLGPCHKPSSKFCCLYQWRYMSWSLPQIIIKVLLPVSMEIHVLVLAINHHQSFAACINGDTCLGPCHKSSSKFC